MIDLERKFIWIRLTWLHKPIIIRFLKLQTNGRFEVKDGFDMEVSSYLSLKIDEIIWSVCL